MMKNQHRYGEISADRSVPIPLQPPHLLQFDTLMFPYRNEKLTSVIILFKLYVSCATTFEGQCKPHHLAKRYSLQKGQIWIIMTPKDWLCRHDICQNFYATDVLSSTNLRKTTSITNRQFARKQHKCLNLNTNQTHCIKVTYNLISQSL